MRRVLVVDDKEENVYFLEALLGGRDCTVVAARHGAEALALARKEPPDLVISDLLMPVMDGYTLLRLWKADSRLRHIPFVVYTATYTDPQDEALAIDLGADAFILKPAEPDVFVARIDEILGGAAASGMAPTVPREGPETQQLYSSTLIRKLEEKSLLLEEANRALARDIAERTRAQEMLSASESALRAVWQASLDALVTMDHAGLVRDLNLAAEQMFGFARDQVLGQPLDTVMMPPEFRAAHRRGLRHFLETGEGPILGQRVESTARRANGADFPVELAIVVLHGGPQPSFIGTIRDITDRKQSQQKLQVSEERFRELAENVSDAFYNYDPRSKRLLYANSAYERIWGRPLEQVLDNPLDYLEDIHPDDHAEASVAFERQLGGERTTIEFRVVRPDGTTCWVQETASPVLDGAGQVERIVGTMRDVTEARAADQRMRDSEERFRLLANASIDAIWDWDITRNTVWWSDGFEATFGYRTEDMIPPRGPWTGLIHEDDRAAVTGTLDQALQTGLRFWQAEYRFRRSDGKFVYVHDRGNIIRDAAGTPVRIIGGMSDISERKRFEARLAEQAELLDKARDAIFLRDLEGRVIYWNKSAERLYGWTAAEVVGRIASDFFYDESGSSDAALAEVRSSDEWIGETEQLTKSGRKLMVESRLNLVRDDAGEPRSILAINTDITEKKRLEGQFLRAQRMESVGTLAGGIAHDLNNVLTPIMMSLEMLRADEHDADRLRILSNVQASANRGADMIRQLLTFTRGVEGVRAAVNLAQIGHEIARIIRDAFPKDIEFRFQVAAGLWGIQADATQIHQVVMNLCVNARDAMPQGGVVDVRMRNRSVDAVQAGMSAIGRPGNYVEVSVRDTGSGIPAHVQQRMFEPFFTTKELGKGTGLGLATVLSIVRSHGGFINVYSEEAKGSTFHVYLPAGASPEPSEPGGKRPVTLPRGRGETILVVDDDESLRMIAAAILEHYGYRVVTAEHGAEALEKYRERPAEIALVLTDMAMPVMDGPALVAALRAINPGLRMICSSGLASATDMAEVRAAGVRHFVPKPYDAETILTVLRQALDEPA
ncbi:MAG: PAS domain S-box protein [Pseudomonadota bacterium]|nr:PAS domain S-box protein [Pseudomonadota bacterium]